MTTRRRIAISVAAVLLGLAVLTAIAWVWWLPSAIRARVASAAERRGLHGVIGGIDVGLSSVVLHDVDLRAGEPTALRVRAEEIRTDAGMWDLATEGAAAVHSLDVRSVVVTVDLDQTHLRRVLERLRGDAGGETHAGPGRTVRVDGLSLVLRDREGVLVQLARARVTVDPEGRLRASAGPAELAPEQPDGARVERVALRLDRRDEEGWKITSASLGGIAVRYRERDGEDRSPLWARIRRHARQLAGDDDREDDRGAAAQPEEPNEGQQTAASGGALLGRVREWIGPRLAPAAVLSIDDLSVRASAGHAERTVLRDLSAEVRSVGEGQFELSGSGRPGRGGRLGWRLNVHPDELRAEGRVDFQRLPFVLLAPLVPALPFHRPEDARLSGELSIEGRGATRLHMDGEVAVDELAFSSARIAPHPVRRIAFGVDGDAEWDPVTRRLDLADATISVGDARAHVTGSLEWPEDHYLIDVTASLPPTDCDTAVGAIPADLLDETGAFTFSGQIGGRVRARIDSRDLDATTLDVHVADACVFETAPVLADVRRFQAPFTHRVVEPDGTVFEMETGPGTVAWTPIREMSPFFVQAVLGHEDGAFFQHHGFSVGSIRQALVRNLHEGRYVYGASTITMQLVKNVFLRREKTLARKAQEVLLTWWVESVMSKEEILELYLNVIEYGPGVYGVRNAAEHYFGVAPSQLGPAESAYLASILPNPKAYHSQWEQGSVPERFRRRVERFLQTLGSRHRYDEEAVAAGIETLSHLRFHRPGEPPPEPAEARGHAAPLPIGPSLDEQWEAEFGPDDPGSTQDEVLDDESDAP